MGWRPKFELKVGPIVIDPFNPIPNPIPIPIPIPIPVDPIKAVNDVVSSVGKAIDDIADLPKKVGEELEQEVRRISDGLSDIRKTVEREAGGAIHLITDAAEAAQRFALQEAKNPMNAINGALHSRDVVSSIWYLATSPIKATNKNAMQATSDSALLAAAAQIAATAYGGPAGAAAYAAWTAYNLTGGDINAALRAGVTTGLIAAATGALAKMPPGIEKTAAEATLKAAVAKAQGKSDEEIARVALAALVQVASEQLSNSVDQAQLDNLQKSIVSGVLGGAAVAATGGNSNDVRDAFLKTGGDVLVQGVRSKVNDIAEAAKDSATGFLSQALDEEDLKRFQQELKTAQDAAESAEAIVEKAKREVGDVIDAAKNAADEARAQVVRARADIQSQVDAARARVIQAGEEAKSRIKLVQDEATKARDLLQAELEQQLAAGKISAEALRAAANDGLMKIKEKADSIVTGYNKGLAEVVETQEKIATEGLLRLEETRVTAINDLIRSQPNTNAIALSENWALSWDPNVINAKAGGVGVVLTYAGKGSEIEGEMDKVEYPDKPH